MKHHPIITTITTTYNYLFTRTAALFGAAVAFLSYTVVYGNGAGTTKTEGLGTNTALDPATKTLNSIFSIIGTGTAIITAAIFLYFFYNVYKFIKAEGDDKEAARTNLLWSVVGIAIFATLWGGVAFLRDITGIDNQNAPAENVNIPGVNFEGGVDPAAGYRGTVE